MIAELPIIVAFVVLSWHSLRRNLAILGAQVLLWAAALGAVRFFSL
jgi:hypothetical protein